MYEIHYSIDGTKRWAKIHAKTKSHALSKLYARYDNQFVVVDGIFHAN